MARPLRLEYAGALYHVTSRGDRQEDIYFDDDDRVAWLKILDSVCGRFNWVVHAYCQMTNHYHLLVETVDGNLSRGMRQLNGQYTQRFNRRHGMVGHLFQGRYKAILVQKETYLLELTRYVVLNPLRARMVSRLEDWSWSSYRAVAGLDESPQWLDTDWVLSQFGKRRKKAVERYQKFILQGRGVSSPLKEARHQLLLGDDAFVDRHRTKVKTEELQEVSKAHRRSLALSLEEYQHRYSQRQEAMARAYLSGAYTMREIGKYFGVHYMTVSRAVRQFEDEKT
jgi:REP element-mobilizing transposase RayT